jgi:hypothetical protein
MKDRGDIPAEFGSTPHEFGQAPCVRVRIDREIVAKTFLRRRRGVQLDSFTGGRTLSIWSA